MDTQEFMKDLLELMKKAHAAYLKGLGESRPVPYWLEGSEKNL